MTLKFGLDRNTLNVEERAKMTLYGRWLTTCYSTNEMNNVVGSWWYKTLKHFEDKVLPEYRRNGSFADQVNYIESLDSNGLPVFYCRVCRMRVVDNEGGKCERCHDIDLPF